MGFQAQIFGQVISLRSLGNPSAFALCIVGAVLLGSKAFQSWVANLSTQLDTLDMKSSRRVIWLFVSLYALIVISHKLKAQHSIGTHAFDLGFFSNICWNTANGHWMYCSLIERNFMGIHANWVLWPISFFYKIWPSAQVLLIVQVLFVAAALPFLWRSVQYTLESFSAGMLASLLFVCSPYINHFVSNDFHPDGWQLPCLTAALLGWRLEKRWLILLAGFLGILAKEDVSVIMSGLAIFLLFHDKYRLTGLILLIGSVLIFVVQVLGVIPLFIDGPRISLLLTRYPMLGGSFTEIFANLLTKPMLVLSVLAHEPTKYWRFFCMFLPAGGLTFLSPFFLIPPLISVLPHLLSQASTQLSLADIYAIPTQPFIFVGAAMGIKVIYKRWGTHTSILLGGAAFIIAGLGIYSSPRYFRYQSSERIQAFKELRTLVPSNASVAAQQNLLPHFDTRRYIQLFPIGVSMVELQKAVLINPDFVAADKAGNALPYDSPALMFAIGEVEADPSYEKVFDKENFLLFKRITEAEPQFTHVQ